MFKILIISDDKEQAVRIKSTLENKLYIIFIATGGLDGLNIILKEEPELVITEILMKEMNGFEIISHIKNSHPGIKVIAMTSGGIIDADDYLRAIKALGANMVIKKPYRDGYLSKMVGSTLNQDINESTIFT